MSDPVIEFPTVVIGAGAGGLVVAIGLAKAGKKVLLIEKGNYGGDCTNFGCIPSKSLIASAQVAHTIKSSNLFGLALASAEFVADDALQRTRDIVKSIRDHEEPEVLAKLGVDTLTGTASFIDNKTLAVSLADGSSKLVRGHKIIIATGSHPFVPPIPGIDSVEYLTNETIFDLVKIPNHLAILGGGPIGCELAQAFHRLGAKVAIIELAPNILGREDSAAQEKMLEILQAEGIVIYLARTTEAIKQSGTQIEISLKDERGNLSELSVSHLLVSVGRRANISDLNCEKANIKTNNMGIVVNKYGHTSQKHIFAVGDVAGRAIFTHVAENEARTVLTNLLLPWPLRYKLDSKQAIPRVTFTDPEVAAIGLTQQQALEKYGAKKIAIYRVPFSEVDRAITADRTEGEIVVITRKWSSKILGAVIIGPGAGELLSEIATAMRFKIPLRKLASMMHAYPTYSLAIRKAADRWLSQTVIPRLLRK